MALTGLTHELETSAGEEREAFDLALAGGEVGVWDFDIAAGKVWRSSYYDAIFGYHSRLPRWGKHDLFRHILPADKELVHAAYARAYETGTLNFECRILRADGIERWISVKGKVRYNEHVTPTGMMGVIQDVTEKRLADENLRLAADRHAMLVNGIRDYALFVLDPTGRVTTWGKGAERMKGYMAGEIIGRPISTFYPPEDIAAGKPERELEIAAREGECVDEGWRIRKDGSRFWARVVITALKDHDGNVKGFSKFTRDISELKNATDALTASNQELEQFAYVASHDLQEPLRMVTSYTQLLRQRYRGKLDSEADEFIDFAVDGAKRMRTLIDDLLAYSRVGSRPKEASACRADAALRVALQNLSESLKESGAAIDIGELPQVRCDKSQLVCVFQNLVGNAIKFRDKSRPCAIRVSARIDAPNWIFSVADNGIGIDPRYADRVFQVFQRLHTREEYQGNGIGLSVCKKIVERHGGRIWIESGEGSGAAFSFSLPTAASMAEAAL